MPLGHLYINEKDAYATYGVSLDSTGLSALMTPAGMKEYVENDSRLEHGTRVNVRNPRVAARDVTLTINLTASTESEFLARYKAFCDVLAEGKLDIRTKWQADVTYHCNYISCTQFSEFMRGIGKFQLKLREPNPTERGRIRME